MLAILLISAALCYTFGALVRDTRQGWAMLAAMTVVFVALLAVAVVGGAGAATRVLAALGVDQAASGTQAGGNMEGKEVRFGIANSALWATATTAASNGSVNSMHDSYTPLGGLVPMWLMQLGEVIYGGVGSGLYGMLVFAIIAVFVAGLMIGRTPEYLGKKIEAFEMKMAAIVILVPPFVRARRDAPRPCCSRQGVSSLANPGAHGFSEILYAFSSAGQQQRQRVRRPVREHAVLQHRARTRDVVLALLADRAGARDRRLARGEEEACPPAPGRCRRTRRSSSCC